MTSHLFTISINGARAFRLLGLGIVLAVISGPLQAQEGPAFHLPDSLRVVREPFFFPSLSYTPGSFYGNQLSLGDQAVLGNPDFLVSNNAAWKRSFLLSASVYKVSIMQPSPWMAKKESFFQYIQAALGVAELAGVAYLGYKAIKKEPVTKKK